MNDKDLEKCRYDGRAEKFFSLSSMTLEANLPHYMRPPVRSYKRLFEKIPQDSKILEIGAGMGENTQFLLDLGLEVCATDISAKSVEVLANRFSKHPSFKAEIADMERLPW